MSFSTTTLTIKNLGQSEYEPVWRAMQDFTANRGDETSDEFWLVEHPPVFTLGLNAKAEHVLDAGDIPLVNVDRGGQVTYHGPGQIVLYTLVDLQRRKLGIRELVRNIEQAVIDLLQGYGIRAVGKVDAPGVYVDEAKIAALGLRVKRGCSYHGLALNVDMDLSPFSRINPCGYKDLAVTQLRDLGVNDEIAVVQAKLVRHLADILGYNSDLISETEVPHV